MSNQMDIAYIATLQKENSNLKDELITTRKELEQSETCCTEWEKEALDYKAENIALSGDLERTRKALEIAVDALKELKPQKAKGGGYWAVKSTDAIKLINTALEQIESITKGE